MSALPAPEKQPWTPQELCEVIHAGALRAFQAAPNRWNHLHEVTQSAWNRASVLLIPDWGHLGSAQWLLRQLNAFLVRPYEWHELLRDLFSEKDMARVIVERTSVTARPITLGQALWALTFVAIRGNTRALNLDRYAELRETIIGSAGDDRQKKAYEDLLPTKEQLLQPLDGDLDAALELLGLERLDFSKGRPRRSLPIPEAGALYYGALGHIPSEPRLRAFASGWFSLAGDEDFSWPEHWVPLIRAEIERRELPTPPDYGIFDTREWLPIPVDVGSLKHPATPRWKRVAVLEAVRRALTRYAGKRILGFDSWRDFSRDDDTVPSWGVLESHGGLSDLIKQARDPEWYEKALQVDEVLDRQLDEEKAARRASRLEERLQSDDARRLLALTQRLGEASMSDYVSELSKPRSTVGRLVRTLCKAGLLEQTNDYKKARNQRYRIPGGGSTADSEHEAPAPLPSSSRWTLNAAPTSVTTLGSKSPSDTRQPAARRKVR